MKGILITGLTILLCLAGLLVYRHFTYQETQYAYKQATESGDWEAAKRIMLKLAYSCL